MIEVRDLIYEYPTKRALEGVSLSVPAQTIVALVGPNGAGKTTLLRCLAALEPPYSGTVTIDGMDTREHPRKIHARLGYLPDFYGLYDELTVRRCLTYASWSHGLDPQARRDLSGLLTSLRGAGMTLVVSSHILAELEDYCSEMIIIENGQVVGGRPIKVKDVERPRYLIEIATARSDFAQFLKDAGVDVIDVDEHHALITFTRNAAARAKLLRDLVTAGFEVSSFSESSKALEDAYFSQVGRGTA